MDRITTAKFLSGHALYQRTTRFILNNHKDVLPAATLDTTLLIHGVMYEVTIRKDMVISVSTYEAPVVDTRLDRIAEACAHSLTHGLGHVSANEILAICKEV